MDPWQTSVESRLTSLDGRVAYIAGDVGTLKTDVAVIKESLRHLPTKDDLMESERGIGKRVALYLSLATGAIVILNYASHFLPHG